MRHELFTAKNVIVQGITGAHGSFHTANMLAYGTNIVAGTSPTKAGQSVHGVPVYSRIADIPQSIDATVIFVPARFAKSAVFEALDAQIPLIAIITEGIPIHDMLQIKQHKRAGKATIIGPNCPGVLLPGNNLLGIIPSPLSKPGDTAIVSRSGTLTYEVMDGLTRRDIGQKYIIGIGGDRIPGTSFVDCLRLFEQDDDVKRIVLIGEIGGSLEAEAAEYIKSSVTKPVYAYIAGHTAPPGVQLGHAGAILGTNLLESAPEKTTLLTDAGAITADNLESLLEKMV